MRGKNITGPYVIHTIVVKGTIKSGNTYSFPCSLDGASIDNGVYKLCT